MVLGPECLPIYVLSQSSYMILGRKAYILKQESMEDYESMRGKAG